MRDSSANSFQTIGAMVVLVAIIGFAVSGWMWGEYRDTLPYAVGILCTALAAVWAAYERT